MAVKLVIITMIPPIYVYIPNMHLMVSLSLFPMTNYPSQLWREERDNKPDHQSPLNFNLYGPFHGSSMMNGTINHL